MTYNLIERFKYLPDEIIHIIINYTNVVVYRHGKFINRLSKNDERYNLVNNIPRPIFSGHYKVLLRLTDIDYKGYFIIYDFSEKISKVNIRFFSREYDGFDKYYEIKSNCNYVINDYNKWYKILHYSM